MIKQLLVTSLLLAAPSAAAAQLDAPSQTTGVFVGANLVGASFDTDGDDDQDAFSGAGLGLELGYGFSSGLALFLALDGGTLEGEDGLPDLDRGQADLGARIHFGGGRRSLVPFLELAFTGLVLEGEESGTDVEYTGGGITVGGGVKYFLSRSLSVNGGVRLTSGALTEIEIDGDREDLDDQAFTTGRILFGATWHP